uniref:Acyl-CoA desaturase n=1 Tax=Macrostomum lignano TaxID=282301 RepID=A0A1I8FS91_9PLAT
NSKRDPDELASIELYEHLNQAGINDRGASKQCRAADGLEDAARQLNPDERLLIGSLAEGWSLSLLTDPQGNGLGKDSIKWLSFKIEDQAHLDVHRKLIKITPYGSGNMLQVNFHSLLMSLQAELLSKEQIFLNEWRRALEPDPDIDELYALAHYSRNTEQIRKCSKKIRELLDCENRGLGDAQKHWSVARKACFNGLFMVTILSVAWSILLNQRFFLDISNIIGQRLLPDLMRFRQTADKIFLELVLALT